MFLLKGRIYLRCDPPRAVEALAVADGRVVAAGPWSEVREGREEWEVVELPAAGAAFPGFWDAHVHFLGLGLHLTRLDLRPARSRAEAVRLVARAAREGPPEAWILGRGWDHSRWPEGGWPHRRDLDPVTGPRPAFLVRVDGHVAWVNTAALEAAGIGPDTPDPPGGKILRDPEGTPTGILLERAVDLVSRRVPPPDLEARVEALRRAQALAHRLGLTGIQTLDGPDSLEAFQVLHERGELRLRTVHGLTWSRRRALLELGLRSGLGDRWLRLGPVKLFLDGTLGSRTAWLLAPYQDRPGERGIQVTDPEEAREGIRSLAAQGWDIAVHAIGDGAVRAALDAFAALPAAVRRARRLRVEHVQLVDPADLPRFAALGVIASVQPIHLPSDRPAAEAAWGERCAHAYPYGALAREGALLALGSDAPVETLDPLAGLRAAVDRQGWYPEQALTLPQALSGYTEGAARAGGVEGWAGSLEIGKVADLTVLTVDPLTHPEGLGEARVWSTWVDGVPVHPPP